MLLNRLEKALMNNPFREQLQRHFEAARLLRMGGTTPNARVLELGCGRGVGSEILLDLFGAARVDAIDLDPDMVSLARRRLAGRGDRVEIAVGDASRLQTADATYDAVFDFAIIHHIVRWRDALAEVSRVLKPGGRFYAEEILRDFIQNPLWKRLLDHPQEDRFSASEFHAALEDCGLHVIQEKTLGAQAAWFVAEKVAA